MTETTYPAGWFTEPVRAWKALAFKPRLTNPLDPLCVMKWAEVAQRKTREAEARGQVLADDEQRRKRRESRQRARDAKRAKKLAERPTAGATKATRGQPGRGP